MLRAKRWLLTVSAVVAFSYSVAVFATNGMFLIGYGAKSRGMGGTAIAMHDESTVTATNPAGSSFLTDSRSFQGDIGLMIFNPQRRAGCCQVPDGEVSKNEWYVIPNMAAALQWSKTMSLGFSFVGAGGGGTTYDRPLFPTLTGGDQGVYLALAEMSLAAAFRVHEDHAIGIGPVIGIQAFRAFGLDRFRSFSRFPDRLTNNGADYATGGGLRVGYQGHFFDDQLTVGAMGTTRLYMSKFDKYKGLFASGRLDTPGNAGLGFAYTPKAIEIMTVAFDWQYTFYESVRAIGNRTLPIVPNVIQTSDQLLGDKNGPGFGWQDQNVYKLGLELRPTEKIALRAGLNVGNSPVRDQPGDGEVEFNTLAPAVTKKHYTVGATYAFTPNSQVNFSYVHSKRNTVIGVLPSGTQLPFEDQEVLLEMRQHATDISYSLIF
jgi:long-chain fatty acid transport protein